MLEEAAIPYSVVRYQRDPETLKAPAELAKVHPLGKSPVLCDGDLVLPESGAIVSYLLERNDFGNLDRPKDHASRPNLLYFLNFAEGSATLPLSLLFNLSRIDPKPEAAIAQAKTQLGAVLDFIATVLESRNYLADDDFSIADIQMSYPLEAAAKRGLLKPDHEAINDYLSRISARPAYRRARAAAG